MDLPRPAEPPGPVVLGEHGGEEEPLKMLEERLRRGENQEERVLRGQLEKAWGGCKAGCDSAANMKGLGLVGEPHLSREPAQPWAWLHTESVGATGEHPHDLLCKPGVLHPLRLFPLSCGREIYH